MPGQISLQQQQYYAHPRNAFWPIMAELFRFPSDLEYQQRLKCLQAKKVALWDVLAECYRPGSLDSKIVSTSVICNDFNDYFSVHRDIEIVLFNGAKSEELFQRYVFSTLETGRREFRMLRMPSTSPANARMSLEEKVLYWREAMGQRIIK